MYKSVIVLNFEYCAMLLIDMGKTQLSKLQKTQNRVVILVWQTCRSYAANIVVYVYKQRLYYNVCIFIFEILNNILRNKLRIIILEAIVKDKQDKSKIL